MSPAVTFIESGDWTESGLLVAGGYVVTNAHVVRPFDEARVVFPDGSEFDNVPVVNSDLLIDLAVLGPIDTDVSPVVLVGREDLNIGSEVYLIGYPGETEGFPQPTLSRGVLSRLREWTPADLTYFQTDAAIEGGQSGGVLVSEDGEAIGISGLIRGTFALVSSAEDIINRIDRLIAGENVSALSGRTVTTEGGSFDHSFSLANEWGVETFVLNEPAGTQVTITVEGQNDAALFVYDIFGGVLVAADDNLTGVESVSATTDMDAPYFVSVFQSSLAAGDFVLSSDR